MNHEEHKDHQGALQAQGAESVTEFKALSRTSNNLHHASGLVPLVRFVVNIYSDITPTQPSPIKGEGFTGQELSS